MTAKDLNRPGFLLAAGFFLAVLGQFFIGQAEKPYTLWLGIGFYALSLILTVRFFSGPKVNLPPRVPLSPAQEIAAFFLILGIGLFFRVYGIHQYPDGVFADRAEVANGAMGILNGQRPFLNALNFHVPEIPIYYLTAGWFALLGDAPKSYAWFDVALSTAGIVLTYFVFRQLTSARIALLAFFFLAVMRFNFAFAHQVYFQSQSVLFLGLTLVFLLAALRKNRPAFALVSGAALGIGLTAYQACKAIPLLVLVFLAFEFFADADREDFKKKAKVWLFLAGSFLFFAAPYFVWTLQTGELGRRDAEVSVLTSIRETGSLKPLAVNFRDEAMMFNRLADNNTQSDFDRHRMLDDGMGILFVFGFFYALTRVKERAYFLAVAGTVVMCLPSILSINGGHAGRSLGCTPFVALTCALFLDAVWTRWQASLPGTFPKRLAWAFVVFLLAFIAWENFHDYFQTQAKNSACQNDCSWTETRVGELIASDSAGKTDYFLPSRFYGHPTVQYLTQSQAGLIHPFDVSNLPKPAGKGRGFCFLLEDSKAGTADFLSREYPGSRVETLANPLGETTLYEVWVPAASLARLRPGEPRVSGGLLGLYAHTNDLSEKPFLIRRDPLINFNFRDLPGTGTPLFIHWRGQFNAPKSGFYEFLVITNGLGQARLSIDGQGPKDFAVNPPGRAELAGGRHSIDLYFKQGPTALATLHLLWKKPGAARYEFVPNGAFGKVANFQATP